jgi:membrane protease subunit HflC
MFKYVLLTVVAIALVLWGLSCLFIVDRTEYVYVTQFGRPVETFDGETEAGLHTKLPWPIQSVQRLDHRLQELDLPEAELPTHDPKGKTIDKMLAVSAYVCWQIAGKQGVDQFIRSVGTPDRARTILGQRINSRLGAEIGKMPLEDLISVAPADAVEARMEKLRRGLLGGSGADSLTDLAAKQYGIQIVDIRLRRYNHPVGVRSAIYERIISERNKKVADYQSEGMKLAEDIKSAADREARDILTDARSQEERLKRGADIKADEIRNQAHNKDREFYTFLQKLEAYQRILGDTRDVLLLSSKNPIFDLLLNPPRSSNSSAAPEVRVVPGKNGGLIAPREPAKEGGQ